jgi:hypothetical protein
MLSAVIYGKVTSEPDHSFCVVLPTKSSAVYVARGATGIYGVQDYS